MTDMQPISSIDSARLKGARPGPGETRTGAEAEDQLALDETVIADKSAEAAFEALQERKEEMGAVRKLYKAAKELADAKVAQLELPEGGAVRVGRFRITRTAVAGRTVSFDTAPTSRVRIALITDKG